MKQIFCVILATLGFGSAANAELLVSCNGVDGYKISSAQSSTNDSWLTLSVEKSGVMLIDNLKDNGIIALSDKEKADDAVVGIYRGVSVSNGVVKALILTIDLEYDGSYGVGHASVIDGSSTYEIKNLNCKIQ